MPNNARLQLRLVIPQALMRREKPVYGLAALFFLDRGEQLFVQEKLLKLSSSLPAILEGEISVSSLDSFLTSFPEIDKIVILTSQIKAGAILAAA